MKRILNGELVSYEFVKDHPGIGECLLLKFKTEPAICPVRPERYEDYDDIISAWNDGEI